MSCKITVLIVALFIAAVVPLLATGANLYTLQGTNSPSTSRTLTFLSSGYTGVDLFLKDVRFAVSSLYNNSGVVNADPWMRYIPLFNIYAVFEASVDYGASRAHLTNTQCRVTGICDTRVVDNNLGCSFGDPNPYVLECDLQTVMALLNHSPARDVVVVLVNETEPAGVASDGVVYITNTDAYMPYLLVHYLNRAIAGLQEEYDMGFEEAHGDVVFAPNCVHTAAKARELWAYWGLSSDYGSGCTFSNYYAPTATCLMRNLSVGTMCPVCKEQLVLSFYKGGINNTIVTNAETTPLSLVAGRCPTDSVTLYVSRDDGFALSAGPFGYQNDVHITWYNYNGDVLADNAHILHVTNTSNWSFPVTIRLSVVDMSPIVRPSYRTSLFGSTAFFTVHERLANTSCTSIAQLPCLSSSPVLAELAPSMCYTEDANVSETDEVAPPNTTESAARTATASSTARLSMKDVTSRLSSDTASVVVVSSVCSICAALFLISIYSVFFTAGLRQPREVLQLRWRDKFVFYALCALNIVCLAMSVVILTFTVAFIPTRFVFGWRIFACCLVLGTVSHVWLYLNVFALLYRWLYFCAMSSAMLFFFSIGFLAIGAYTLWASTNRYSLVLAESVVNTWTDTAIKSDSVSLCEIQEAMTCSGFNTGCFMTLSSQCPDSCTADYYVNSCREVFLQFLTTQYRRIAIVCIIGCFLFLALAVLDGLYYSFFNLAAISGRRRRMYRLDPNPPVTPITNEEAAKVKKWFYYMCNRHTKKGDRKRDTLDGRLAIHFLETVFAEKLSAEYKELLSQSGLISFDELMCTHFPYAAASVDPKTVSRRQRQETWEFLDNPKGTADDSLDHFKEAVGALSPGTIHTMIQQLIQQRSTTSSIDILDEFTETAKESSNHFLTRALTPTELEGLRGAWIALNPKMSEALSEDQIEVVFPLVPWPPPERKGRAGRVQTNPLHQQ
ncbi:hypothetical protein STCU_09758 [Strigomonas culicis]|uniref:Uncharacterized protein n=1 Tax=Strigomonas culicis TaxID=28005 RepID=S9V7A7_9TRYP|nr:hypothetical protein STCU_09758 [Strigomonas culicis]|eukprot:EPY18820.1 hypothetical protein STCU_09758 [Strigomonas culicis]